MFKTCKWICQVVATKNLGIFLALVCQFGFANSHAQNSFDRDDSNPSKSAPNYQKPKTTWILSLSAYDSKAPRSELRWQNALEELRRFLKFQDQVRLLSTMPNLGAVVVECEEDPSSYLPNLESSHWEVQKDEWRSAKKILKIAPGPSAQPRFPKSSDPVKSPETTSWWLKTIQAPTKPNSPKGRGVKVMVIDSGTDLQHPAFKGKTIFARNFLPNAKLLENVEDEANHGVSIAGLILGSDLTSGFQGVAPEASYYSAKICDRKGCPVSSLLRAFEWAIQEKVNIANVSITIEKATQVEISAVDQVVRAGITVVAASGNESGSLLPFPAFLPQVISVGSVAADLSRSAFSTFGPQLTLVAPGEKIEVPMATGRFLKGRLDISVNGATESLNAEWDSLSPATAMKGFLPLVSVGGGAIRDVAGVSFAKAIPVGSFSPKLEMNRINNLAQKGARMTIALLPPVSQEAEEARDFFQIPVLRLDLEDTIKMQTWLNQKASLAAEFDFQLANYGQSSGTSLSAPLVSGAIALLLEKDPNLLPFQIKDILEKSANPIADAPGDVGSGLLNVSAAIESAQTIL